MKDNLKGEFNVLKDKWIIMNVKYPIGGMKCLFAHSKTKKVYPNVEKRQ